MNVSSSPYDMHVSSSSYDMHVMSSAVGSPFTCRPLFLVTLAQQCRLCYGKELDESTDGKPIMKELSRSRDMRELYHNMLQHLHDHFSEGATYSLLVPKMLALVWAGRRGLLESEVMGCLAMEESQRVPQERFLLLLRLFQQRLVLNCGLLGIFSQKSAYSRSLLPIQWVSFDTGLVCAGIFHWELREAVGRFCLGFKTAPHLSPPDRSPTGEVVHGALPGLCDVWTPAGLAAHRQVSRYFATKVTQVTLRKVEELPWQICRCIDAHAALSPLLLPPDWKPPPPAALAAFEAAKARAKKNGRAPPKMGAYGGHISAEGRLVHDVVERVGALLQGWDDGLQAGEEGRSEYLEQLSEFLLQTHVLRELATLTHHADLCLYWRYVCWQPGSLSQLGSQYISSLQGYVMQTGDKGALPALIFAVAFLLEDLQQFRPAALMYMECVRTIEHLQLMHPLLLNALKPHLAPQLIHMMPKAKLHLAFCLRKGLLIRQSQLVMQECLATVASNKLYEWARVDVFVQAGLLAKEWCQYGAAEKSLDKALQSCAPHDITAQARVLDEMMDLYREAATMKMLNGELSGCQKMLDKEYKAAVTARRLWTDYLHLEADESSRPASALVALFRKSKRPQSAAVSSVHVSLGYDPRIPNQATNLTVNFTWGRNIDVGDHLGISLQQLRAGGDKVELELDGPYAFDFVANWTDMARVLTFVAHRALPAFTPVTLIVAASSGLRLPVKQGGVAVALKDEAVMEISKARLFKEGKAYKDMRPQTGKSSIGSSRATDSRPPTMGGVGGVGGFRPMTRGSENSRPGTSISILEDAEVEGQEAGEVSKKGSLDACRLLSRAADILSLRARLQGLKHDKMIRTRDAWLAARHKAQTKEAQWMLRSQHDERLEKELLSQLDQEQVNELDAAHLVYANAIEEERAALHVEVETMLDSALLMQTWLLGDGHPSVSDTLMISVRMLMARKDFKLAAPLLVQVWEMRTGFDSTELLPLGHPRELECSLFHVARDTWRQGEMKGAVVLLEALLVNSERNVRDIPSVKTLLAISHVQGMRGRVEQGKEGGGGGGDAGSEEEAVRPDVSQRALDLMDVRTAIVAHVINETNARPLSLDGWRFSSGDVLEREGAMVPETVLPVWPAFSLALSINHILRELDLSDCAMGSQGFTHLSVGLRANKSISTLSLARNNLGVKSGGTLEALLRANSSITSLDLSSNGLQDRGVSQLASGIAATLVYNTSLRHLNLRDNAIRVEGALELGCAMKMDTVKITSLDISLNPLGSLGVSHLVDPIFLGRPMVTFKASDCQIGMEGIIKVAEAVGVSTSLSALSLSNTRKQIAGGQKFANEIDDIAASILAEAGTNSAKYSL